MPRSRGRPRDDPERLSTRQQEWLDAARRHFDRTGEPPSRVELVAAMGCTGKSASYVLGVLERKGRLVPVHNMAGGLRHMPVDRAGDTGRPTVEAMVERIRRADDATLASFRDAIEAEAIRRG